MTTLATTPVVRGSVRTGTAALYVSAFEPGDLEHHGAGMVAAFAAAALAEMTPGELAAVVAILADTGTPGSPVAPGRLASCEHAATVLADAGLLDGCAP